MFCKYCGNQLSDSAKFCDKCSKPVESITVEKLYAPASIVKRLVNFIVDRVFNLIFFLLVLFVFRGLFSDNSSQIWLSLLSIFSFALYYIIFEGIWQKTIAKFMTRTKVVMRDGSKPPLLNIIGRSFSRIIPFEQFSFLFGAYPVGWHDYLSKTIVVPSDYTAEDVKKIDFKRVRHEKGSNVALVIIVVTVSLLVVIAFIGILSSIVLVSLNVARQKGQDTTVSSSLSYIQAQASLYNENYGNYSVAKNCYQGMYSGQDVSSVISKLNSFAGERVVCYAENTSFAVSAKLISSDKTVCVDNNGFNPIGIATDINNVASCQLNQTSLSASSTPVEQSLNTYSDRRYFFSVQYPSDWETYAETTGRPYSIFFIGPNLSLSAGLRGSVVVNISENNTPQDLKLIASQFEQQIQEQADTQGNQWKILSKSTDTFLSLPAFQYVTTKLRTFDNGKTYVKQESKIILFTKGNLVYDVEYKNDIDNFDRMLATGDQVIASLQIK